MTSHPRILTFAAAVNVALICAGPVQSQDDAAPKATKITTETPGIGDLSHALNVRRIVGTYQLSAKVTEVRLILFFYHDGELVKSRTVKHGLKTAGDRASDSGKFALQIVDLDYLTIRDAKPHHHRLHYQIANAAGTAASNVDIPKSTFDVASTYGTFRFSPKYGKPNEAPLFAIVGGKTTNISAADTPDAVVKANPEADILIAVLKFKQ